MLHSPVLPSLARWNITFAPDSEPAKFTVSLPPPPSSPPNAKKTQTDARRDLTNSTTSIQAPILPIRGDIRRDPDRRRPHRRAWHRRFHLHREPSRGGLVLVQFRPLRRHHVRRRTSVLDRQHRTGRAVRQDRGHTPTRGDVRDMLPEPHPPPGTIDESHRRRGDTHERPVDALLGLAEERGTAGEEPRAAALSPTQDSLLARGGGAEFHTGGGERDASRQRRRRGWGRE